MPVFYLETSALLKKYRTERGTETVQELFQGKTKSEVFVTSHFTVVETASVAARLLRARTLTNRSYRAILGRLSRDLLELVRLESVSDAVLTTATELAQLHVLRAPDAIHLATALGVRVSSPDQGFYFLGSDARLKIACESSGLEVLDPETTDSWATLRNFRAQ